MLTALRMAARAHDNPAFDVARAPVRERIDENLVGTSLVVRGVKRPYVADLIRRRTVGYERCAESYNSGDGAGYCRFTPLHTLIYLHFCHHAGVFVLEQMTVEEERTADDRITEIQQHM